jgi:5-formyltetrahydrofolate cyclo-ligase
MEAVTKKTEMRNMLRARRKAYVAQHALEVEPECAKLAHHAKALLSLGALIQAHDQETSAGMPAAKVVIASFKPQHSETNPKYLEEALMLLGHQIVWPRVEGEQLRFFSNDDMPAFVRGAYGLQEPGPRASEKTPNIILVPLLGFDEEGHRLGQGGGFYDRTLRRLSANVLAIGVAWECQKVAAIPVEGHDMPLAGVICPSGFHRF